MQKQVYEVPRVAEHGQVGELVQQIVLESLIIIDNPV